jgi:hypothetical protein
MDDHIHASNSVADGETVAHVSDEYVDVRWQYALIGPVE